MREFVAIALVASLSAAAAAADEEPQLPSSMGKANAQIVRALMEVRRKYGADAVMLQGQLLTHAIQSGSVLEATSGVSGLEEREQHRYLTFRLETGIVYNDRELTAEGRLGRAWSQIVERSLRQFRAIEVPADGLALVVVYAHKPYADEPDLRAHLHEDRGVSEAAVFYLLKSDVTELMAARISGQQLADRATVLVDGTPRRVVVEVEATEPDGRVPPP